MLFPKKIRFLTTRHDAYLGLSIIDVLKTLYRKSRILGVNLLCMLDKELYSLFTQEKKISYAWWLKNIEEKQNQLKPKITPPDNFLVTFVLALETQSSEVIKKTQKTISAVLLQSVGNWEFIVISKREISRLNFYGNKQIKFVLSPDSDNIFDLFNESINKSNGQFIAFIQPGDSLSPRLCEEVYSVFDSCSDLSMLVCDEDMQNDSGERFSPFFKPDWNPDYFFSFNYFSRGIVYQKDLMKKLGGYDCKSVDPYYHLSLRAMYYQGEKGIRKSNEVLFHFSGERKRGQKFKQDYRKIKAGWETKKTLLAKILNRNDFDIISANSRDACRLKFQLPEPAPLVSIIIPIRDRVDLLAVCISGLLEKTDYSNFEIIVIDNDSRQPETLQYLEQLQLRSGINVLKYPGSFNYAEMNNQAVKSSRGKFLVFLNNDIEIIESKWLTEMVSQACRPEIGCVGAKLFYPDGTIQHAGVILGLKGFASHAHKGFPGNSTGYFNRLVVAHNVSAVTGACMVMRKAVFEEVGGFDSVHLKVAYNDVDLCLKVQSAGYRNLFTPHAKLIHHESKSRGKSRNRAEAKKLQKEAEYFRNKWKSVVFDDPAYNENLTLLREDFSLGLGRPNKNGT